MFPDPGKQHDENAIGQETDDQRRQNPAQPARLLRLVGQVWLDDPLDIGLLAPRLVASLLKRSQCGGQPLVGIFTIECQTLVLNRTRR